MKSLVKFICDSLNESQSTLKNVLYESFNKKKFEDDCTEVLATLVDEADEKPDVWDDTFSWDPLEEWDEYQDTMGDWDDSLRVIKKEVDGTAVAVWTSKDSYEDALKKAPKYIDEIVADKNVDWHKVIYKKGTYIVEKWECTRETIDSCIIKFKVVENDHGTETPLYCYLVAIGV